MNLFDPIYFSVGEGLFVLSSGSFQLLHPPAALEEPGGDLCWEWRELPKHPFDRMDVTSYAVHPDGRTIFVSTSAATFTFDTAKVHRKWRRHGSWTPAALILTASWTPGLVSMEIRTRLWAYAPATWCPPTPGPWTGSAWPGSSARRSC